MKTPAWSARGGARCTRIAACVAALLVASPAFAEWTVSKDMGSGYIVRSSDPNVAPFKASTLEAAQAQADVLNKFEQKQGRKNK